MKSAKKKKKNLKISQYNSEISYKLVFCYGSPIIQKMMARKPPQTTVISLAKKNEYGVSQKKEVCHKNNFKNSKIKNSSYKTVKSQILTNGDS